MMIYANEVVSDDDLAAVLRRALEERGVTQAELGDILDRGQSWVASYLLRRPAATLRRLYVDDPSRFDAVCDMLALDRGAMLGAIGVPHVIVADVPLPRALPVYSTASRAPLDALTPEAWVNVPTMTGESSTSQIGLRVEGDAHTGYLEHGDIAVIDKNAARAIPGDRIAVYLPECGYLLGVLIEDTPEGALIERLGGSDGPRYHRLPPHATVIGRIVRRITSA
jgi:hypothetical protein